MPKHHAPLPDITAMTDAERADFLARGEEIMALERSQHDEPEPVEHDTNAAIAHRKEAGWAMPEPDHGDPADHLASDPSYKHAIRHTMARQKNPQRMHDALMGNGQFGEHAAVAAEHGVVTNTIRNDCTTFTRRAQQALSRLEPLAGMETSPSPGALIAHLDPGTIYAAFTRVQTRSEQMDIPREYRDLLRQLGTQERDLQMQHDRSSYSAEKRHTERCIRNLQEARDRLPGALQEFIQARIAIMNPLQARNADVQSRLEIAHLDLRDAVTDAKWRIPVNARMLESSEQIVMAVNGVIDALVIDVFSAVRQSAATARER